RRDALFDEGVPFVALWTLPQQLGAAIPAAYADMRVEVEDRLASQVHVLADERRVEPERRQHAPRLLVDGEPVRVVGQCGEEEIERASRLTRGREVTGEREPGAPVLRILRDHFLAQRDEPFGRARLS